MILAEKITLLRKKNGWSQEELAARLGVSRQAISKWESAQTTPDLNRVLELSRLFGVSTDILLKDEESLEVSDMDGAGAFPPAESGTWQDNECTLHNVSMEEANDYLRLKAVSAGRIAVGVMMCILSPVVLILLGGAQSMGLVGISENQAAGIGILILMLLVGAAVGLFVYYGMRLSKFEYITREPIETAYGVEGMVRERKERYENAHLRYMVIGILLCVLSCIPIFIGLIAGGSDMPMIVGVCALLIMAAIGVMLIVRTSIIMEAMQALLEEGEYSRQSKQESRRNETIMGIYWLSATAIYLLVSFLTRRWDITWVIWPVAGVGCGILAAVLKVVRSRE